MSHAFTAAHEYWAKRQPRSTQPTWGIWLLSAGPTGTGITGWCSAGGAILTYKTPREAQLTVDRWVYHNPGNRYEVRPLDRCPTCGR